MKRIFIYSLVGIIAAFASCDKNNPTPAKPDTPDTPDTPEVVVTDPVFTASIADTKTVVDISTGKVTWESGDEITVTDAASVSVVYTTTDSGASATFTKKTGETATLGAGPYTAVYGSAPLTAQTYSATIEDLPMTATSSTTSLTFSVSCGIMAITLSKDATNISSVKVGNGTDAYTLSCATAESIEGGKVFHLVLPAGTYTSFEFVNDKGGVCLKQKSGESVSVAANTIQPVSFSNIPFAYIVHDATELYSALTDTQAGDKIMLASGTYTATKAFSIQKDLTLEGGYGATPAFGDTPDPANYKAVLDGVDKYRVITIAVDVKVNLSGLVLKNGYHETSNGGNLYMTKGTLHADYVNFEDGSAAYGGAFMINGASTTASFTNCIISGCSAVTYGGSGYFYNGVTIHFDKCVFKNNTSPNLGGALYIYCNTDQTTKVDISNSEFYDNTADSGGANARGGAIYARGNAAGGVVVNIANSTFHGNSCYSGGSAVAAYGVEGKIATVNIYSCTFTGNSNSTTGGAICSMNAYGFINHYNSIILGNTCTDTSKNGNVAGSTVTNGGGSVVEGTLGDYLASTASTKEGFLTKAYKVKTAATTAGINVTTIKAAYTGSNTDFADALGYDQWGAARTGTTAGACVSAE